MVVPIFNGLDVDVTFICCTIIVELCFNFYDEAVNNLSTALVWVADVNHGTVQSRDQAGIAIITG
jgi:hypothetical protein